EKASRLRARQCDLRARTRRNRPRHRAHAQALSSPARLRWLLRSGLGADAVMARRGDRYSRYLRFDVGSAIAVASLAAALSGYPSASADGMPLAATGSIEAAFTPGDSIDAKIVTAVGGAEREVLVLAYLFTHPKIAQALSRAHARGV